MKRGHLTKRQPRGRRTGWGRGLEFRGGELFAVVYRVFARLSTTGAVLMESRTFDMRTLSGVEMSPRACIAIQLLGMRAQVRWRRDKLDLENLGEEDTTPAPIYGLSMFMAAVGDLPFTPDGFDPKLCQCTVTIVGFGREARKVPGPTCAYCERMHARVGA